MLAPTGAQGDWLNLWVGPGQEGDILRPTAAHARTACRILVADWSPSQLPQLAACTTKALPVFCRCLQPVQLIGKGVFNRGLQPLLHPAK